MASSNIKAVPKKFVPRKQPRNILPRALRYQLLIFKVFVLCSTAFELFKEALLQKRICVKIVKKILKLNTP